MENKNKFLKKEKLKIIFEASEKGVETTLKKYNIPKSTYYYWVKIYADEILYKIFDIKELTKKITSLQKEIDELTKLNRYLQAKLVEKKS